MSHRRPLHLAEPGTPHLNLRENPFHEGLGDQVRWGTQGPAQRDGVRVARARSFLPAAWAPDAGSPACVGQGLSLGQGGVGSL